MLENTKNNKNPKINKKNLDKLQTYLVLSPCGL